MIGWTVCCGGWTAGCSRGPGLAAEDTVRMVDGVESESQDNQAALCVILMWWSGVVEVGTRGVAQLLLCHYFHSPNSIECRELFQHAGSDPKQSPVIFCNLNT